MLRAIVHQISPQITECEVTFVDRKPINFKQAVVEFENYCHVLEQLGVNVTILSANEKYPDACFVEDTAVVMDEIAVICRPGAESRREETRLIENELSKYRKTVNISSPATIDGGDILRIGKRVFVGESTRTNLAGINQLAKILNHYGYEVIPVTVQGSLHLKTACTAINEETLLLNQEWIDVNPLKGFNLIQTPIKEPFGANTLRIGDTLCLQAGFPQTKDRVEALGEKVELVKIPELAKAEAGLTCLSIIFES